MRKVILSLSILAATLLAAAQQLYQYVPAALGNSVIAEKSDESEGGNQVATLLPKNMSEKQYTLLNMAYDVAKENNFKNPEILQAILLQETRAGGMEKYRVANPGPNAYFGAMQIKLVAARDVLAKWPGLYAAYGFHTQTDDEVKANLILNDRFNIDIAAHYLLVLKKTYGLTGRALVNAYNQGPEGVKNVGNDFHYAIGAEQKLAAYQAKR